jgi:Na+/H+ antiporter NhaD/arsenite permease-like protein
MVGGLEAAGVWDLVVQFAQGAANVPPVYFGVALIWTVAILSAVIDNVPVTIAFIPIIQGLGRTGMDIDPLWWALAFGAGFGGNGTIIGSTANIIVAGLSERTRHPITPRLWFRRGLPVMLLTCLIASIIFAVFYPGSDRRLTASRLASFLYDGSDRRSLGRHILAGSRRVT